MVMYSFKDLFSKFRHNFRFSKEEIEACIISVLAMAFIVSFDEWGYGNKFDFNVGLGNFIKAIIIMSIIIGLQLMVIKAYALYYGYRAEFKLWWYGIIAGLILAFFSASVSRGAALWFLAPGGIFFHHMAVHRIGWFRYGVNIMETGWTCMWGALSTIMLAVIFKLFLFVFPDSLFFEKAMIVSLWFALFSILPIPPLLGSRVFFWSRLTFSFILGIVIGFNLLLRWSSSLLTVLILSIIVGIIVWALMLWKVES
jgi:Zn-dependent protease